MTKNLLFIFILLIAFIATLMGILYANDGNIAGVMWNIGLLILMRIELYFLTK